MNLVTGASGFLGGRLTQILCSQGQPVRILARENNDLRHLQGLPVEVFYGELENEGAVKNAVQGCERIYHCGGLATDWAPWEAFYGANVLGVQHLVSAALRQDRLDRFVHISTSDVYGYPIEACDETYPLTDVGLPYNRTKILGEQIVWSAFTQHGLPITILRPASIYGPRSKDFVFAIANFLKHHMMATFDGGTTHAGLVYVDNAVDAIIAAASSDQAIGQAYNLRDDLDVTWGEYLSVLSNRLSTPKPWLNINSEVALRLAWLLEKVFGLTSHRFKPFLTRHAVYIMSRSQGYSIDKIRRDVDFRTTIGFEDGIDYSIEWLQSLGQGS